MSHRFLLLSLFLVLPGCADLYVGRSHLAEMEHDDTSFFNPGQDFPMVAGDEGRYWMSERERRKRTPASEEDFMEERSRASLKQELQELEANQSEGSANFYNQHKHKLGTISEKIYFLKLPPGERKDYLLTRGLISEPKAPLYGPHDRLFALREKDIILGMKKEDVLDSWGKPLRVEIAGNPRNENERWLYKMNGASKYIYFESGEVQGWE